MPKNKSYEHLFQPEDAPIVGILQDHGPLSPAQLMEISAKAGRPLTHNQLSAAVTRINAVGIRERFGKIIDAVGKSIARRLSLSERFQTTFGIAVGGSYLSHLSDRQRRIMRVMHAQPVAWQHALAEQTGMHSSSISTHVSIINEKLSARNYPIPLVVEKRGFYNRISVSPEFARVAGILSTKKLGDYFRPRFEKAVRALAANPGMNKARLAEKMEVSRTRAERDVAAILRIVRVNRLPGIYNEPRQGMVISPEFAEMFDLPRPPGIVEPLLNERQGRVFKYLLAHPRATQIQMREALRIGKDQIRNDLLTINKIISRTHRDEYAIASSQRISRSTIPHLPAFTGRIFFRGRWLVPYEAVRQIARTPSIIWAAELKQILLGNKGAQLTPEVARRIGRTYPMELIDQVQVHLERDLTHLSSSPHSTQRDHSQLSRSLALLKQYRSHN